MSHKEVCLTKDEQQEFRDQFGSHNDFPPNWNEITAQQFFKRWFTYSWSTIDWRQMLYPRETLAEFYDKIDAPPNRRHVITARLFVYNDKTGIAITQGYDGSTYNPRYFEFGVCMHKNMVAIPEESRMCYHVSKCADCGYKRSIDSSD
jgi:hypothetical protein